MRRTYHADLGFHNTVWLAFVVLFAHSEQVAHGILCSRISMTEDNTTATPQIETTKTKPIKKTGKEEINKEKVSQKKGC